MPEVDLQAFSQVAVKAPTDQEFAKAAARQRQQMGGTLDQVFNEQSLGEGVRRHQQKRRESEALMSQLNIKPWSVVNLMPFPLNVPGVLHSQLPQSEQGHQIDACRPGQPYVHLAISKVMYSTKDEGAGMDNVDNYTPIPWAPKLLAEEYGRLFLDQMQYGGIIIYEGDQPPETPGLKHKLEEARVARNKYLLRKVEEANADAADPGKIKNVTALHRAAAEVLLHDKVLKHQPVWLLQVNSAGQAPDPCPGCGEVSDAKAAICKTCPYVYRPLDAYKAGLIEYGHVSMDRLTEKEWKEAKKIKEQRDKARSAAS